MNAAPVIKTHWTGDPAEQEALLEKEWLVTNGLGGYASGTLAGVPTRRYHSVITASLPAPQGRYVMLNHLSEWLRFPDGGTERIGGVEWAGGAMELQGTDGLREFRLESGVPVWRYELRGHVLEKWILMPHLQNTVHVGYRLLSGTGPLRIELRVAVHFRGHGASLCEGLPVNGYDFTTSGQRYEIHAPPLTPLRLHIRGVNSAFTRETKRFTDVRYRVEEQLGYEAQGDLWSPGYFRTDLSLDGDVVLMASLENWETILALDPTDVYRTELQRRHRLISVAHAAVRHGGAEHLVLAADQFIVTPAERLAEMIRTRTAGDELRTVIAGYHWFTDWGRDTMISLEGLTLLTGRYLEAGHILRTFSRHMKDGLIPNLFPEGE
ncbi:MAG: glycogen debranching enzyme N-terminal domain-containing protein, partial [Gammaproteobacteria bacterium]